MDVITININTYICFRYLSSMAFSVSAHIKRIKKFTTYVREYKITLIFNDTVRMQKGIIQLSLPSSKDQPIISDGLGVIKKKNTH